MILNGNSYNFGRVVYLTIGKITGDPYLFNGELNKLTNVVTIAFDPKKNTNLTTRLDFIVRHQYGQVSNVTGSAYSLASIDIYNIGPALQQLMNAYNDYDNDGYWKATNISKYVCALQVGYYGSPRKTIFAGAINSYNVERKQNESTVDTVWHLFCAGTGGYSTVPLNQSELASSGEDYFEELQKHNQVLKSYVTGEDYLKAIVMDKPREVYYLTDPGVIIEGDSFSIIGNSDETILVPLGQTLNVTNKNFDSFFEIKYQYFNSGKEDTWAKNIWQNETITTISDLDTTDLQTALSDAALKRNCGARIQLDESTGKQIIYIYSLRGKTKDSQKKADWIITNFQNLRKPPLVSGKSIRFDMLLEPTVHPNDTFELRVTETFKKKYGKNNLSFGVNFDNDAGQWSTVFAGSNFDGLSNVITKKQTLETIKQTGNVFNKRYIALYVIHQGSTHDKEWSTTVDCVGVEI